MGWVTYPLESLCKEFTDGNWVESKDQSPEGIRLIQTGNIGEGVFKDRGDKARYISEATFSKLKCFEIFEGDCLISRLPDPVGRSCVLPDTGEKMITAVDCTVVRFDARKIIPAYFNFYAQSNSYLSNVDALTSGATRKRISRKNLGKIEIPIPSIPEQKRIVAILDQAFSDIDQARALTEQNLKNARELFESYLQKVFSQRGEGWGEYKLGDLFNVGSSKRIMESDWVREGIPFYGGKEIVQLAQSGRAVSNAYITREKYSEYSSKYDMPKSGDILMTARGTIGVGYIVQDGDEFYYKDGNIIWLGKNSDIDSEFVLYAFKAKSVTDQLNGLEGTTVRHLPIKKAKEILISCPNFEAQIEVVKDIKKVQDQTISLCGIYESKLEALDLLKSSLLQKAFSGELTKDSEVAA